MLKHTLIISLSLVASQFSFAATTDALHLSGKWVCSGYDKHDGPYSNATLTFTLDPKNSDFAHNYGAYTIKLIEQDGTTYLGEVTASGNTAAVEFENTSPQAPTDRGVGIASITHDADQHGNITTVLHKFYYEPTYKGGGNGLETCIKQH